MSWGTWLTGIAVSSSSPKRSTAASPWVHSDAEPDGDWVTDSAPPLIHAIAPRAAAVLALRMAEETDARVAELPLERMAPRDPDSPISPARGEHRREHLDEMEGVLRDRGRQP